MTPHSSSLHHITAVASDPQRNLDFYQGVLGQRLVKRTVNFDDPATYHLYYGDAQGTPGTIITFFPWRGMRRGTVGAGESTCVGYAIPIDSISFWKRRLEALDTPFRETTRFGEPVLHLQDPDGMALELIGVHPGAPDVAHWQDGPVPSTHGIRGFHSCVLCLNDTAATQSLLVDTLGYVVSETDSQYTRLTAPNATHVILEYSPDMKQGAFGSGSIHHVAFRASNDDDQLRLQSQLNATGLGVTEVKDRQYFKSVYFREPGGVLFEIATDSPGFLIDESIDDLGKGLKLPPWIERRRAEIEARLPKLEL